MRMNDRARAASRDKYWDYRVAGWVKAEPATADVPSPRLVVEPAADATSEPEPAAP
jgi:hypothetical protein